MSMNLILANNAADNQAEINWTAIQAAASNEHGMVFISDETVKSVGRLVNEMTLSNGETVTAYCCNEDDGDCYGAMIRSFGPSLLPTQVQDQLRDRLAAGENGADAVRLFNKIIHLKLQVSFSGTDHCQARIKCVNWVADEVEINRCSGNMYGMLRKLGLGDAIDANDESGEVSFDRFATAVNDNGRYTDMAVKLERFVECGRRTGATKVYWA